MNKKNTTFLFVLVAALYVIGSASLLQNLSPMFADINARLEDGSTIVMNDTINDEALAKLLVNGGYVTDASDAKYITEWFKTKIAEGEPLENLGAINSNRFRIPADSIEKYGGEWLKARLGKSRENIGQNEEWAAVNTAELKTVFGTKTDSTATIKVTVNDVKRGKILGLISTSSSTPQEGVPVRLTRHWKNKKATSTDAGFSHESEVVGYAVTDKNGVATFNVPFGKRYSVLPIKKGFQYGDEKGTSKAALGSGTTEFSFAQNEHKIRAFDVATYNQLKRDMALISRTPAAYENAVTWGAVIFILSWVFVLIVVRWSDRRSGKRTDGLILISIMALTGIGLLTQYGQMMPLSDIFNARSSTTTAAWGCVLMALLSCIDYLSLSKRYRMLFSSQMGIGRGMRAAVLPGLPFLLAAIVLMFCLRLFGTGPEGSDAKVNLWFFQPSEVVKYFVVVFIAFFLTAKGDVIKTYGERMTKLARRRYLSIISSVIIGIGVISLLFLALLKDMGPGIVILATFILMYSIARRDMPQLLLGIISYFVIVGIGYAASSMPAVRLGAVALWFVLWIAWGWSKKTVYESAIFFNVLVSLFLVGGYLIRPFLPSMATRLFNRTGMCWGGIFDNAIPQGDQIAHGLWGTASGGLTGMGIGGGSSYYIPAGHTDLILSSLGEQMGWIGIVMVVVFFFVLITRTTTAAQYSGNKFLMYMGLGIGLLTGVQFLFIALGCIGAIPLSGVPVPFLSCTRTGVLASLAIFGIVISISRHRANSEALSSYVASGARRDDAASIEAHSLTNNLFGGMALFFTGVLAVIALNGYYQIFAASSTKIRPSITSTDRGLRIIDYNPRIRQIMAMLDRGNIYDRKGRLLATSDRDTAIVAVKQLDRPAAEIDKMKAKRMRRYYPYGNDLVFMVGDLNNSEVYTNYGNYPIGYIAEQRHADLLTGLDLHPEKIEVESPQYVINKFIDPVNSMSSYLKYDYSILLPALAESPYNNRWVKQYNSERKQRDISLTVDADLQTEMQAEMAKQVSKTQKLAALPYLRISLVVLDAENGDLITSSNYPTPITDSIKSIRTTDYYNKSGAPSEWRKGKPVTERDLGLTYQTAPGSTAKVMTALAGFRKHGAAANDCGYDIKGYMSIEPLGAEPYIGTPQKNRKGGKTTYMENAIKYSSNCYFVMLLNEEDLYEQAGDIYWAVGASLDGTRPYHFDMAEAQEKTKTKFDATIRQFQNNGLRDYNRYINRKPKSTTWHAKSPDRMSSIQEYTGIAWGQSRLDASPLNMARVASIVGNGGKLTPTRYLMSQEPAQAIDIIDSQSAKLLASAMESEAAKWTGNKLPASIKDRVGGKTGTPMRAINGKKVMNDGWYICYVKSKKSNKTIAIALRMERLPHGQGMTSGTAVQFVGDVVIPTLQAHGYI